MRLVKAKRHWIPFIVYAGLTAAVLGTLLRPGYILTLDMVFVPQANFTTELWGLEGCWTWISPVAPLHLLIQAASNIMPGWLIQKIILFFILFLAGLGAHRLVPSNTAGSYFAGILYMVNPFIYTRFLAGQWQILWAYAFLPFAIAAFIALIEQGGKRNAVKVALLSTLVGLVHIAGIFLLFLAFIIILVVKVVIERRQLPVIAKAIKNISISAGTFLFLNLYWIVPVLTAEGTIVNRLSQTDLYAFAPLPSSHFGVTFDIASMYGFWRGGYTYTKDILPFWWVLFLFILYLTINGFVSKWRDTKQGWIVLSFGVIGIVSFLLALGTATETTKTFFIWLSDHISLFRGFRDSQKFVALLCLGYACLGGLSVNEFVRILKQQKKRLPRIVFRLLVVLALLTPLAYSFNIFGFHGQIEPTDFPKEWYEVEENLNTDKNDFNVLCLPWHRYMDYRWLPNKDKRLGNPAQQFFDKQVIAGDNIEMPGIYSQSTNPISKYVEFLLERKDQVDNLGELLAPLNVKYIILVHESDYGIYNFLYNQKDLRVIIEKPGITLFENDYPIARVYAVNSVIYIDSLEEYIDLSTEQDVMEHLYVIGSESSNGSSTEMEMLHLVEESPVRYTVSGTSLKYTTFNVPQNVSTEAWTYNGEEPVMRNLGFMPAFESSQHGGEIKYNRFYYVYLPSYILSILTLSGILMLLVISKRRSRRYEDEA